VYLYIKRIYVQVDPVGFVRHGIKSYFCEKRYGNYMSVWKKQDDGSWKFVLDGGNTTPPPVK
jgi:hypothetical protein